MTLPKGRQGKVRRTLVREAHTMLRVTLTRCCHHHALLQRCCFRIMNRAGIPPNIVFCAKVKMDSADQKTHCYKFTEPLTYFCKQQMGFYTSRHSSIKTRIAECLCLSCGLWIFPALSELHSRLLAAFMTNIYPFF